MSRLTILTLAAVAVVGAAAQDRPLVFHVGAELVVLDVIATDAGGREVSDLTPAEVRIQEDGHDYLETLARETGGRVFLNTNDPGAGLLQAQRDAQSYYLVGYEPLDPPRKSAFREVRITTTRRGVTLRYRRGYYAMSERERAGADIDGAMRTPGAFRREGFLVSAATNDRVLRIDVRIPSTAIRIGKAGDNERATFAVHAELRSAGSGRPRVKTLPGKDVVLDLSPERMNAIRASDKVAVRLDSPAPSPGTYVLTVVARDSGGWIGAHTSEVVVAR